MTYLQGLTVTLVALGSITLASTIFVIAASLLPTPKQTRRVKGFVIKAALVGGISAVMWVIISFVRLAEIMAS